MTYSSCLIEPFASLFVDSSVLINLLATGRAEGILTALNMRAFIAEEVAREIERGEGLGKAPRPVLGNLVRNGTVQVTSLTDHELEEFALLVAGTTSQTLGDGEAATMSLAVSRGGYLVMDERKATRLCERRYPEIRLATTIDLLAHEAVGSTLSQPALREAVLGALQGARMQVRATQYAWVAGVIGDENVVACPSLRRLARAFAQ